MTRAPALLDRIKNGVDPRLHAWILVNEKKVLTALERATRRAQFSVHTREHAAPETAAFGGLVLRPGTWMYFQSPGGGPDAVELVGDAGTYWNARRYGGTTPYRVDKSRLGGLGKLVPGNYAQQFDYLERIIPDAEVREGFVEAARRIPQRQREEREAAASATARAEQKYGPWFADIAAGLSNTGAAWVLKSVLKRHGVLVRTEQRRYSMASGIDFHYNTADQEKINSIFPGLADSTGGAYPLAREDRSDPMSDVFRPGGFRVAPVHVEEVSKAVVAQLSKQQDAKVRKSAAAPAAPTKAWQSEWTPRDILVVGQGNRLWIYDRGIGHKDRDYIAVVSTTGGKRVLAARGCSPEAAPDLTFKKLEAQGVKLLAKYLPQVEGRRVLLRGSGWYGDRGRQYENYAHVLR